MSPAFSGQPSVWRGRPGHRRDWLIAVGLCVGWVGSNAAGQERQKVSIECGSDRSGHEYTARVRNHHTSPIVSVEFPHYRVDMFLAPEGWSTAGTTNALGRGNADTPGVCKATALSPDQGIRRGQEAEFQLRVRPQRAWRGTATVTVGFADGSQVLVPEVPLPQPEPPTARGTRLIGYLALGLLSLAVLVIRGRRRRANSEPSLPQEQPHADGTSSAEHND